MTSRTEAFTASAGSTGAIGATYTWSGNQDSFRTNTNGQVTTTSTAVRIGIPINGEMSGPDHFSEAQIVAFDAGVACRVTGGGDFDGYYCRLQSDGDIEVYRWFATYLGKVNIGTPTPTLPGALKMQATDDGSTVTLELFWNGASVGTLTESSGKLTGNFAGIHTKSATAVLDDWAAADDGVVEPATLLNSKQVSGTQTTTFDVSEGSERLIAAWVHIEDTDQTIDPDGCSIAGIQMVATPVVVRGDNKGRWFYLLDAEIPAGAGGGAEVVIDIEGGAVDEVQVHLLLLQGVHQAAPISAQTSYVASTALPGNITTTDTSSCVLTGIGMGNTGTFTLGYGVLLPQVSSTGSTSRTAYLLDAGSPGAQSVDWAFPGTAGRAVVSTLAFEVPSPEDVTPPSVTIDEIHDTTVRYPSVFRSTGYDVAENAVDIGGTASDDVGVDRVEVSLDGGPVVVAQGTTTWSTTVQLTGLRPGRHTVTVTAYDTANNSATASKSFVFAPQGVQAGGPGGAVAVSIETL